MKKKWGAAVAGTVVLVVGLGVATTTWSALPPAAPKGAPAAPAKPAAMPRMTGEEKAALKAQLEREGKITYLSGPKTMCKTLRIAGKEVRLPAKAFVKDYFVDFDCAPSDPCPTADDLPMLVIAHGKSELWISEHSGKVFLDRTDSAEPGAFRFMEEVGLK